MKAFFSVLVPSFVLLLAQPQLTLAQGLVACTGARDCNFCTAFQTGVNIINLLFQLMVIAAVILIVIAGLRLVVSAGNVSAMEKAKSMITNVIIGFVIVLSAWLIVDTIMKVLLNPNAGFGTWNELNIGCDLPGAAGFDEPLVPGE